VVIIGDAITYRLVAPRPGDASGRAEREAGSAMKSAAMFALKSAAFSVIFCVISAIALLLLFSLSNRMSARGSGTPATTTQAQQNEYAVLLKKYLAQAAEADTIQESQNRQLIESAGLLKKQEELLNRWDMVIQRWEKIPAK